MSDTDEYGKITDEGIQSLRDRIGDEIDEPQPFNEEATKDAIRHWCHGVGHENPLYTDEKYARKGPYGEITAPPLFLFSCSEVPGGYATGLPGVHEMWAGCRWKWYEPIRRDDAIRTESWLKDVEEKDTSFAGRSVVQTYETEFYNQNDDHLASAEAWNFRYERSAPNKKKESADEADMDEEITTPYWDDEEIDQFRDQYRNEERRGEEPRYFEDVDVRDELDTILKGPYTVTGAITFLMGWSDGWCRTHRRLFELFDKLPGLKVKNEKHGMYEPPEMAHWNDEFAQSVGHPDPYDFGPERVAWLGHVCEYWMGDEGFLKEIDIRVHEASYLGDVTWCSGEITDTRYEDGEGLVDVDLKAVDHRDRVTASGEGVIQLPLRDAK